MTPDQIQKQIDVVNAQIALVAKQRIFRASLDAAEDARQQKQVSDLQAALAKAQAAAAS